MKSSPFRFSARHTTMLLVGTVFMAAVVLRSRNLGWGLPDIEEEAYPMKKAFEMWGWGTGHIQLDPATAGWPSLSFYLHMILQGIQYGLGRLTGQFGNRQDFFLQTLDMSQVAIWARWLGVLAAGVITAVGARLGARLAGLAGGALVGITLLASPLLARHAQLITPDILLTMFAALALERIIAVHQEGRLRDEILAGLWIGLGASTKYTPAFLVPVLVLAHLQRRRAEGRGLLTGLWDRRLVWAGVACVLAFAATSPYLVMDGGIVARDVGTQMTHLQGGHFGHESQRTGLLFYVLDVLGPGLGWPAFLLGISGLAVAVWRRRGVWLLPAAAFLVYYLVCSSWQTRFDRYLLPGLLPLALGVGFWPLLGQDWPQNRRRLAAGGLALLVLVPGGFETGQFLLAQGRPGTLAQAKSWVMNDLADQDPYFAMELYTPALPRQKQLQLRRRDPALPYLDERQRARFFDLKPLHVVYLPFYSTSPHKSDFYYDLRHYLGYDFIVTSSFVRGRYEARPDLYPRQCRFYADLDRDTRLVRTFRPGKRGRGPELRFYGMDDAARRKITKDMPPVTENTFRRAAPGVVGSHFQDFVKTIADHALSRGMDGTAALYYQPLYATLPPVKRMEVLPVYATACARAGHWAEAEPLLEQWLKHDPNNPQAKMYLERVLAHDPDGDSKP